MIHASLRVPICKLKQFQEILGACHGTFDYNPIMFTDIARVSISFKTESDGETFIKRWRLMTYPPVVEKTRKPKFLKRIFNSLKFLKQKERH